MDFVLDIHNHTVASGHAYSTVMEYVAQAAQRGLELIAITDHAPAMPACTGEMHFLNFSVIPDEIDGVRIMMGVELNILNSSGDIDLSERTLKNLSPVIASFHPPTYSFSQEQMSDSMKCDEITNALLKVMENEFIDIIGHLGDPRYPFNIERIVKKSLETGTLIEINNASLTPISFRYGARDSMLEILTLCKKYRCPIVAGTDSHFAVAVGRFDETEKLLEEIDFPRDLLANTSAEYFLKLLKRRDL